jgi:hypothetical protein
VVRPLRQRCPLRRSHVGRNRPGRTHRPCQSLLRRGNLFSSSRATVQLVGTCWVRPCCHGLNLPTWAAGPGLSLLTAPFILFCSTALFLGRHEAGRTRPRRALFYTSTTALMMLAIAPHGCSSPSSPLSPRSRATASASASAPPSELGRRGANTLEAPRHSASPITRRASWCPSPSSRRRYAVSGG